MSNDHFFFLECWQGFIGQRVYKNMMEFTCLIDHLHQRLKFEQKDYSPKIHFQISLIGKLFGIVFNFFFVLYKHCFSCIRTERLFA